MESLEIGERIIYLSNRKWGEYVKEFKLGRVIRLEEKTIWIENDNGNPIYRDMYDVIKLNSEYSLKLKLYASIRLEDIDKLKKYWRDKK